MLRLAASLKYGHVTASLIVAKLSRVDRQNSLAAALKEYGALRRTVYAARYLSREDYRRKISRQLNKGESMHALRRDVFYAHEGAVRRHHLAAQTEQAWCLTIATNAISAWTTEYLSRAGRRGAPRPGTRRRGRVAGARLPGAEREHRPVRHHHCRHRPRTCPTRPHRLPAATSATRDDRRHLINPCRKRPPQGRWVVVLPGKRGRGQRCVHKRGTSETVTTRGVPQYTS